MSLERGRNDRDWSVVTKDLAIKRNEHAAWRNRMITLVVMLILSFLAVNYVAKSDIAMLAKTPLTLIILAFALILIAGIYFMIEGGAPGKDADAARTAGDGADKAAAAAAAAAARAADEDRKRAAAAEAAAAQAAEAEAAAARAAQLDRERAEAEERAKAAAAAQAAEEARKKAEAEAAAAATTASAAAGPDRDGDGVVEGKDEGTKPATLDGARGGVPDDLKLIKGVGPKLEALCNSLGFWHFDQIAAWTPDEVAWVDSNLEGFTGRVSRDEWVDQAKILAAGGTTEFSERQKDG